ncbi:MAG: signal peptidase II [Candidatus Thiodiazotropha sp. DIVDIV]
MLNTNVLNGRQFRLLLCVLLIVIIITAIKQNVYFFAGKPNLSDSYSFQLFVYYNPLPIALQLFTDTYSTNLYHKLIFFSFLVASWWHIVSLYKEAGNQHHLLTKFSDVIFLSGLTSNVGELIIFNSVTDYILLHFDGLVIIFNIEDIFLLTSMLLSFIPNHYLTNSYIFKFIR